MQNVIEGKFPANHQILYNLQEIFNLMPNLSSEKVIKSFLTTNNDVMMSTYISSITRVLVYLHKLINNRIAYKETVEAETKKDSKKEEKKEEKAKVDDNASKEVKH